jgi:hypothetical protein
MDLGIDKGEAMKKAIRIATTFLMEECGLNSVQAEHLARKLMKMVRPHLKES